MIKYSAHICVYKGKWIPLFEERVTFNQLFLESSLKMGTVKMGILKYKESHFSWLKEIHRCWLDPSCIDLYSIVLVIYHHRNAV